MKFTIECIARAFLTHSEHVLLCQNIRHGYYFLPGGHVDFGEPAATALRREMLEEIGIEVDVQQLILVSEEAFSAGKPHHELNLVFHVALNPADQSGFLPPLRSIEPHIAFSWVPFARIAELDIRPATIKSWLAEVPSVSGLHWRSGIIT